jgi:lysophospholipid acyltransferase (LPLAT)-like uncharacterized protein
MPLSASQRLKAAAIGGAAFPLVAALGRTLTWRIAGGHYFDDIVSGGKAPILALWHGRIMAATLYWRNRGIVAMTSENFDGEWVARLMARFGFRAARGSTSRGGSRALVQLRKELKAGHAAAFTVDGPRGPARQAQRGAVWLAGATGCPILPFHIEASRSWTAGSWDRTMVPRPFSTAAIAIGPPFDVPGTTEPLVEEHRRLLETRLSALEEQAAAMLRT